MDFLTEIMALKRARLERARRERPEDVLRARAEEVRRDSREHAFRLALNNGGRVNVIAEFKRASPSKGIIRAGADPALVAREYEAGGAAALSVLTEEDRFSGSLADLAAVRAAANVPVLRKDFIFDEYQLYEAAAAGADALLLIVAALDDDRLYHLRRITEDELRMDALVEVHTRDELRRAEAAGAALVGVNNRDLRSFKVSLDVSIELAQSAAPNITLVAESGLTSADDIRQLRALGYSGFLVGESLMRAPRPGQALRELIGE